MSFLASWKTAAALRRTWCAGILGLTLLHPPALRAQGIPLSQILPQLFGQTLVLEAGQHMGHFQNVAAGDAALLLNVSLVSQLASSPPINSSAGGFTYEYDPVQDQDVRTSDSFGPIFAERPGTLGKGRLNIGVSSIHFEYDALDNISLTNGDLIFDLSHEDVTGDGTALDAFVEGDLVEAKTFVELKSDTTAFFINWGMTERIDLGLVVPVVSIELNARVDASVRELATSNEERDVHAFRGDVSEEEFFGGGSASGIGDVIVRGKLSLKKLEGRAMSAAVEVRLPTGDEEDLLGTGETQVKLFLIGSGQMGPVSSHVNLGYTLSGGDLPDELNFAAGFDAALHPRVSVAVDLLSRTLFDTPRILLTTEDHVHCVSRACDRFATSKRRSLSAGENDQTLAYGSLGVKFNPWGELLITTNLLFSLSDDGLQDEDVIPLVGVDYSF